MQPIKQTPPDRMTPDQRRAEVALLALGLVRLREHNAQKSAGLDPESGLDLGFLGDQRVHSDPVNERTRKSR